LRFNCFYARLLTDAILISFVVALPVNTCFSYIVLVLSIRTIALFYATYAGRLIPTLVGRLNVYLSKCLIVLTRWLHHKGAAT